MKNSIAFVGKMGSGKTALAEMFVNYFGASKLAFADSLKKDIIKYNLTVDGKIDKSRDRSLLQDYGQLRRSEIRHFDFFNGVIEEKRGEAYISYFSGETNYIGNCYLNYWTDRMFYQINNFRYDNKLIVNDDIRRLNEQEMLKKMDFLIIKIETSDDIRFDRLQKRDGSFDSNTLNNISETEVDKIPYDFLIYNNDTIDLTWNNLLRVI